MLHTMVPPLSPLLWCESIKQRSMHYSIDQPLDKKEAKMIYSVLIMVVSFLFAAATSNKHPLHVMVILSTSEENRGISMESPFSFFDRAEELLSAAHTATNEINNCSDVLSDFEIELIPISAPDLDPNRGLIDFVQQLTSNSNHLVGIVGNIDNRFAEVVLPVAGHTGIDLIQLVDSTTLNLNVKRQYPHTFTTYPSLAVNVETALYMFQTLHWRRVGLVYSSTQYSNVYLRAVKSFISLADQIETGIDIVLIDIASINSFNTTVNRLNNSSTLAFLLLLPPQVSSNLISSAQEDGREYAWVIVENEPNRSTFYRYETLENTIIIHQSLPIPESSSDGPSVVSLSCRATEIELPNNNPQARHLYNSIWALSLGLNSSLDTLNEMNLSLVEYEPERIRLTEVVEEELIKIQFPSDTRPMTIRKYPQSDNPIVDILQIQSTHDEQVGYFNLQTKTISLDVTITIPGLGPTVTRTYTIFPRSLTYFTTSTTGFCFILITISLLLYFLFRNEPEVKATSTWLSLCMYIGCYLILGSSFSHFLTSGLIVRSRTLRMLSCNIDSYAVTIGVDLLFSTLLLKVIRVWRIFTLHGRTGKWWTDQSLLVFIGGVVLVKIVILVIWTAVDTYQLYDVETLVSTDCINSEYQIVQQCESEYYSIWFVIVYGYSTGISVLLVAVAIKSRKIEQENFRDTKKISILVTSLIFMAIVSGALWGVLRLIGNSIASKIVLGLALGMVPILCQTFLFLPKILPPLQRRFRMGGRIGKNRVTSLCATNKQY